MTAEETIEKMRAGIPKIAKNEMEYFHLIGGLYPSSEKYEDKILKQFEGHYHSLIDLVLDAPSRALHTHSLVINGAILRSLNAYRGAIWALGKRNPHVLYNCLRFQCETLALIHYCVLKPEYVETATLGKKTHPTQKYRIVKIGRMIDKLDKKFQGIREDYDSLCELVHPNPSSLYANIKPLTETEERIMLIGTTSPRMTEKEADTALRMLIFWTDWLLEELHRLFSIFKQQCM